MSLWTQLGLLLGKNLTLRKRQPVSLSISLIFNEKTDLLKSVFVLKGDNIC